MATRVLMREIQADTEAIWKERRELLEDIHSAILQPNGPAEVVEYGIGSDI